MKAQENKSRLDQNLFNTAFSAEKRRIVRAGNTGESIPRAVGFLVVTYIAWGNGNNVGVIVWALAMILIPGPALFKPDWFYALPDKHFWPACTFIGGIAYPLAWNALPVLVRNSDPTTQLVLFCYICVAVVNHDYYFSEFNCCREKVKRYKQRII